MAEIFFKFREPSINRSRKIMPIYAIVITSNYGYDLAIYYPSRYSNSMDIAKAVSEEVDKKALRGINAQILKSRGSAGRTCPHNHNGFKNPWHLAHSHIPGSGNPAGRWYSDDRIGKRGLFYLRLTWSLPPHLLLSGFI